MNQNCALCGNTIPVNRGKGNRERIKYCSAACLVKATRNGNVSLSEQWGVNASGVGAITELITSIDLMKRGYDVFKALSMGTCDLVAIKNGKCIRIEVKSGYTNINGKLNHTKVRSEYTFDVLAIVAEEKVVYRPDLL